MKPVLYTITDWEGKTYAKKYRTHGFKVKGWKQRYDRVAQLPDADIIRSGKVLQAQTFVLDTVALKAGVLAKLREDSLFFVDRVTAAPGDSPEANKPGR